MKSGANIYFDQWAYEKFGLSKTTFQNIIGGSSRNFDTMKVTLLHRMIREISQEQNPSDKDITLKMTKIRHPILILSQPTDIMAIFASLSS